MRYEITRTSRHEGKPCEEAFRGELMNIDIRGASAPHKIPAWRALGKEGALAEWLKDGSNHRKINGHIARDMGTRACWFIDIPDLDALMALHEKYGELVIGTSFADYQTPRIEIYDDYRE